MFGDNLKIKDIKLEVGQLVKSFRKQGKISQQELAELLDLSRITIQNMEAGKNFTIDSFLKVIQYFDALPAFYKLVNDMKNENENLKSLY